MIDTPSYYNGVGVVSSNTTNIVTKRLGTAESMQVKLHDSVTGQVVYSGMSNSNGEFYIDGLNTNRKYFLRIYDTNGVLNGAVADGITPIPFVPNTHPIISSISPSTSLLTSYPILIKILGENFDSTCEVYLNDVLVSSNFENENVISFETPTVGNTYTVRVTNSLNQSSNTTLTISDDFDISSLPNSSFFILDSLSELEYLEYEYKTEKTAIASNTVTIVNDATVGLCAQLSNTTNSTFATNFNNGASVAGADGANSYYMVAAFYPENATNTTIYYNTSPISDSSGYRNLVIRNNGGNIELLATHWFGGTLNTDPYAITLNNWIIAAQEYVDGELRLYVNGELVQSKAGAIQSGGSAVQFGRNMIGKIKFIGFVYDAPDANTRQKIEGWIAHECNLTSLLPVDHPYKSVRP